MKPRKPFLVRKRKEPKSLLDIRRQELSIARLDLIRFEDLLSRKPNNAYLICEVDRYKSRIDCLELAIQTLECIRK